MHMFVISLHYPAELTSFMNQVFKFVTFEAIPFIDEIYEYGFNFAAVANDQPLNDQFGDVGYDFTLSVRNLGSMWILICLIPVYVFFLYLLENCCCLAPCGLLLRFKKKVTRARQNLYWNDFIKGFESSLIVLVVCALVQL